MHVAKFSKAQHKYTASKYDPFVSFCVTLLCFFVWFVSDTDILLAGKTLQSRPQNSHRSGCKGQVDEETDN